MSFSRERFKHFNNIIHLNIRANADHYLNNGWYRFPPFHGCRLRNRNGTNKLIDINEVTNAFFLLKKDIGNLMLKFLKTKSVET